MSWQVQSYKMYVLGDIANSIMMCIKGSHLSGDKKFHVFSRLFLGKRNEIPG